MGMGGGAPAAATTGKQETAAGSAGRAQQTGRIYKKALGILAIVAVLSVVHFRRQCPFPRGTATLVTLPQASECPATELRGFTGLA